MVHIDINSVRFEAYDRSNMGAQAPVRPNCPDNVYRQMRNDMHLHPEDYAAFYGGTMTMTSGRMRLARDVARRGGPRPLQSCAGWTLGIIQIQWIETNWASYRGRTRAEGSILVQRAGARTQQACRDHDAAETIWFNAQAVQRARGTDIAPHLFVIPAYSDAPFEFFKLVEPNTRTGRDNLLHEAQVELHFCTILSAHRDGVGYQHLCHFYWNRRWQAIFHPPPRIRDGWRVEPVRGRFQRARGALIPGGPTNPRIRGMIEDRFVASCNEMTYAARNHAIAFCRPDWAPIDVHANAGVA